MGETSITWSYKVASELSCLRGQQTERSGRREQLTDASSAREMPSHVFLGCAWKASRASGSTPARHAVPSQSLSERVVRVTVGTSHNRFRGQQCEKRRNHAFHHCPNKTGALQACIGSCLY